MSKCVCIECWHAHFVQAFNCVEVYAGAVCGEQGQASCSFEVSSPDYGDQHVKVDVLSWSMHADLNV